MKSAEKLLSIIVPVFRSEKYIHKCIDSVIGQDYSNWELIIVDDGSPDRSGIICDQYAQNDSRIKVIHKTNGGVSSARNMGIENAQGEYITFVDSDDWLEPDYCSALMKNIDGQTTFVACGYKRISSKNTEKIAVDKPVEMSLDEFRMEFDRLFEKDLVNPPFCKLYKKEVMDQQRFDPAIKLGEDFLFNLNYISKCEKMKFIPDALYNYNVCNEESATKKFREDDFEQIMHLYQQGKLFKYQKTASKQTDAIDRRLCVNGLGLMQLLYYSKRKEAHQKVKSWIGNQIFYQSCLPDYHLPIVLRIPQLLVKYRCEVGLSFFYSVKKLLSSIM